MTYQANVLNDPKWYAVWQNFLNGRWVFDSSKSLNQVLEEWNATDMPGTDYVNFRSEYDAVIFLITWSS